MHKGKQLYYSLYSGPFTVVFVDIMHEHKTNSNTSVSALDTRDNKKLISKSSVFKPKSATEADTKTIPQLGGDIRCKHKTTFDSSERQYITKVETVFTSHCTFLLEKTHLFIEKQHEKPTFTNQIFI